MNDSHSVTTLAIQETMSRFMNAFDTKDWSRMRSTLSETLLVDYSSLRGEPAREVAADEYVSAREAALGSLRTHHVLSNFEVSAEGDRARARASAIIFRSDGRERFDSHALYDFALQRENGGWRITRIAQRILWNDGNPALHSGVPRDDTA